MSEPIHHAEDYRGFLLYLLREVWQEEPHDIGIAAQTLEGKGLYFLFWSPYPDANNIEKQDQIYPLYVGITGRTFKQRFTEHINYGVVHKITSGQWPKVKGLELQNGKIVAYVVNMPLPVAKFFESVFLYSFDFAMNVGENGKKRDTLQFEVKQTVKDGINNFTEGYAYMKMNFANIDNMVSEESMAKGACHLHYYEFKF